MPITTAAIVTRDDDRFVGGVTLDGNMLGAMDQRNIITFYTKKSSSV